MSFSAVVCACPYILMYNLNLFSDLPVLCVLPTSLLKGFELVSQHSWIQKEWGSEGSLGEGREVIKPGVSLNAQKYIP